MKKTLTFVLVAAVALFLGNAAYANYCARDVVPSATLLVPYIAVGMTAGAPDPDKATTYFGITNVSKAAQIIHITVWDALSNPEIDFDIVLSGYDVWEINWRDFLRGRFDIFVEGSATSWSTDNHIDGGLANPNEPFEWGPDGRDTYPGGTTGILSTPDERFASGTHNCTPNPPYGDLSTLSSLIIGKLTDVIAAKGHNGCGGMKVRQWYLDNDWLKTLTADPLFFYATADVVKNCSLKFPSSGYKSYFDEDLSNANVIVGDMAWVNPQGNKSEVLSAVHIESDTDAADVGFLGPDGQNFYNEFSTDYREPLATAFAFRYKVVSNIVTTAVVWKDTEEVITTTVDDCGSYLYYAWDEDEHSKSRQGASGCSGCVTDDVDPNEFPWETQAVPVTYMNFDVFKASEANGGWFLLVFPPSYDMGFNDDSKPQPSTPRQAWVGVKFDYGSFSGGMEAATLGNANCNPHEVLPKLNTYDGGVNNNNLSGQFHGI